MALFQKKIGPVFLKEESDASEFIEKMKTLSASATGELKDEMDKQIKLASYGVVGENNIAFELKNSGIDMFILHDIYLEYGDLSAQIDYIIFTRKRIYVIECKNLIGNIEIDNTGKFIRTYEINGKKFKEGVYSPITQNERHLMVLREIRKESKSNIVLKMLFDKNFDNTYKSLVVLANPKTYLNDKYAKKDVKEKVIRADQLIATIKKLDEENRDYTWSEAEMKETADFFLAQSKPNKSDYSRKYEELLQAQNEAKENDANVVTTTETKTDEVSNPAVVDKKEAIASVEKKCPKCGSKLVLRTAKSGSNAGNEFYGCSGYPNCRYIENI